MMNLRAIRRLDDFLACADLGEVLKLVSAVDALQSSRAKAASQFIVFPPHAETDDPTSPFFAHKWRLETLVTQALLHCYQGSLVLPGRKLNTSSFKSFIDLFNAMHRIEGEEYDAVKNYISVFDEVHRLTQRQFAWQRGFFSMNQIYRHAFLLSGPLCKEHILSKWGYTVNDLSLFCIGMKSLGASSPVVNKSVDMHEVFLAKDRKTSIIKRLSIDANGAKQALIEKSRDGSITYSQSILRTNPLIALGRDYGRLYLPLPELAVARSTYNSFYDFAGAHGAIRNEIGKKFEQYAKMLMERTLSDCKIATEFTYGPKRNKIKSPDLFCFKDHKFPDLILECKSVRMTFDAKFSPNPLTSAATGYEEIAKGIYQIWKYACHRRQRKFDAIKSDSGSIGIVLTLDSWLTMSPRQSEIRKIAYKMASEDVEIDRRDDIPVIFCTIDDLEDLLSESDPSTFFATLVAAAFDADFKGWLLPNIHSRLFGRKDQKNPYPFEKDIDDVLPWWKTMSEIDMLDGDLLGSDVRQFT